METIMTKFRTHAVRPSLLNMSRSAKNSIIQLAAQQHELTLTRHYEALLAARESQQITSDLTSNSNMSHSLQRLCHYLRGLLKTMAGENTDSYQNSEPDYDGPPFDASDLEELTTLLEKLDTLVDESNPGASGRQDWAIERESEISRLEKENEELRRVLGIDEANMSACGVTVDAEQIANSRQSTLLSQSRRAAASEFAARTSYQWDNNPQQQNALQRMDLQPGMRGGQQARRTGIFGAGQQRGGFPGGTGRGVSLVLNNPTSPSLWNSIQPSNSLSSAPLPWQLQGNSSGLDMNR